MEAADLHPTKSGNDFHVLCPVHGESSPSLHVTFKPGEGRTDLHCFGCEGEPRVLAEALGLGMVDLYDDPPQCRRCGPGVRHTDLRDCPSKSAPVRATSSAPPVGEAGRPRLGPLPRRLQTRPDAGHEHQLARTLTYDYCDVAGTLVQQVQRHQCQHVGCAQKSFRQVFVAAGGDLVATKPAVFAPVLYRLPEVAAAIAAGAPVWVCEGEKDADAAAQAGAVATTNAQGSGSLTAEMVAVLAGADVRVVLDRDGAGWRRGVQVHRLLQDIAARVRLFVPAVDKPKADLSDHLDAGHALSDLIQADVAEVAAWAAADAVQAKAATVLECAHEAELQVRQAYSRPDTKVGEQHRANARRWALESARRYEQLVELVRTASPAPQTPWGQQAAAALDEAARGGQQAMAQAHQLVGTTIPQHLISATATGTAPARSPRRPARPDARADARTHHRADDLNDEPDGDLEESSADRDAERSNVVPMRGKTPDLHVARILPLPTAAGQWWLDVGTGDAERGVYVLADRAARWVAPLPYVHARIQRRGGDGRLGGMDYLISATEDGPRKVLAHLQLKDGTWANQLGLPLSLDRKVSDAAATAVLKIAEHAPLVEAVPQVDEHGRVTPALADTLPAGYMDLAPDITREQALAVWSRINQVAAEAPKVALMAGASAIAPFLGALGRQSHVVSLYGEAAQGKTQAMSLAGSIWGAVGLARDCSDDEVPPDLPAVLGEDLYAELVHLLPHAAGGVDGAPGVDGAGAGVQESGGRAPASLVRIWQASPVSVFRYLGQLGVLPAFMDEIGANDTLTPAKRTGLIYSICLGGQRQAAESRGSGNRLTPEWRGVLFSSGNGRLLNDIGAGDGAGIHRRVIELETPITTSAVQSNTLDQLRVLAYGHMGAEILHRYSTRDVQVLIAGARLAIAMPMSDQGAEVAKHVYSHVAGAAMLDQIAGTGTTMYDAAIGAAREYLQAWTKPEHDADRILLAIRDGKDSNPASWPTKSAYRAWLRPKAPFGGGDLGGTDLPQHGIRDLMGVVADDGSWVAINRSNWKLLCAATGADSNVACRELHRRGRLDVTANTRGKKNEWVKQMRVAPEKDWYYVLDVRPDPDELDPTSGPVNTPDGTSDGDGTDRPSLGEPTSADAQPTAPSWPTTLPTPNTPPVPGGSEAACTGPDESCTGSVRGDVRGTKSALTCDVRGVRGPAASSTHTGARETSIPPVPVTAHQLPDEPQEDPMVATFVMGTYETAGGFRGEFVAYDEGQRPCACCGRPCNSTFAGIPMLHRCATGHPATTLLELRAALGLDSAPRPDSSEAVAPPNVAASVQARTVPAAQQPTPATTRRRPAPPADPAGSKYTGQAACADVDGFWTGDGTCHPLPNPLTHVGQLADLADRLRLGVDTGPACPDGPATIAVTAALAAQLGVPTDLGEDALDWAQTFTATTEGHPVLTGALAAGWATSSSTDGAAQALRPWTRLWRAQGGSRTVFVAWLHALGGPENQPIAAPGLAPARVARRLDRVAGTTTAGWRVSGSATGMDLLKSLHWKHKDRMLAPQPKLDVFVGEGAAFNWTRPPTTEERRRLFLHLFDRNGSWAAAGSGLELGYGAPEHRTGGLTFDKRIPGAWHALVPAGTDPQGRAIAADPDVRFPNPIGRSYTAGERVWLTTPTLEILAELGWELDIDQAWVWPDHGRLLDSWTAKMSAGRSQLDTDDPDDRAARDLVKTMYTKTLGMMGSDTYLTGKPGYAPHSLQSLQARSRANIVRRIRQIGTDAEARGQFCWPVVVVADMVGWVSDDPDPATAWPGTERWFGTSKFGQYKPEASALLDDVVDAFTGQPWSTRAIEQAKDRGFLVAADRWDPAAALAAARARRGE